MSEQERREPAWSDALGQPAEEAISVSEQPAGPSVGERIRQAREAAGLTAADLAQPLNLDLRVIENIERDALDDVPGRPYILAYLRSWAGQLGIDAEGLIEQYNRQQGAAHGEIQGGQHPTLDVMEDRRGGGNGGWGRLLGWMLALVVAAIVVLVLMQLDGERVQDWWQDLTGTTETSDGSERSDSGEAVDIAERGGAVEDGPGENDSLERPPAPSLPAASPGAPATLGMRLPEARLPAVGQAPESEASESEESTRESSASAATNDVESAPGEASSLVLRAVSGESWVEIRDAAGDRLMYDVLTEGESRAFEGGGPFTLVLGNPAALEVEYAGEPVDLVGEGGSAGVLRMTVGDS